MTVNGSRRVIGGASRIYQLLQDPEVLAASIPGCRELKTIGEGKYAMRMNVALAALSGDFQGTVEIKDQEPPLRFRMIVEAAGRMGFLKGEGVLTLQPEEEQAAINILYTGRASLGGAMAAVGHRLLDATSKMMIRLFFERFESASAAALQKGDALGAQQQGNGSADPQ